MMLIIQLLLLAYALACAPDNNFYFSIPVMAIVSIVLIGMRGLAVALSNPFGEDSVDFDIELFMKGESRGPRALRRPFLVSDSATLAHAPSPTFCQAPTTTPRPT